MNKEKLAWLIFVGVFVLPPAGHFIVNLYWWLFDGNQLITEKMAASGLMVAITGLIAFVWLISAYDTGYGSNRKEPRWKL